MSEPTTTSSALAAARRVSEALSGALLPLLPPPARGVAGLIGGVIDAGLQLGQMFAALGRDPVQEMLAMKSAVPAWLETRKRAEQTAAAFVGHRPGDDE